MSNVRATITVQFYGELPDDDGEADGRFDEWTTDIEIILNAYSFANGIVSESFSVRDGDTELDA